ncbi:MAG: NUDIX domain-containing protein [Verrucomicrobiota bacterium]
MTRYVEPFDVVDENDRVVGVQERSVVHKKGLLHRAIHVFVFNEAGHIYLQRRSMNKDTAPGKWVSSCSGHVDSGEDYDTAALRELGEEIGLHQPGSFERVFKETPCPATGNEFVWVYRCSSEGPFILNPLEVIEGKWVGMQDLDRWIEKSPRDFSWSFVHLWALYQKI